MIGAIRAVAGAGSVLKRIKKPKRRERALWNEIRREKEHHKAIASGKSKMHKTVSGVRSRARR